MSDKANFALLAVRGVDDELAHYVRMIDEVRAELAALRTDRDELRDILIRMLTAYGAGHVVCNVSDSQWWPALEEAQNLLGARQQGQLIRVATEFAKKLRQATEKAGG